MTKRCGLSYSDRVAIYKFSLKLCETVDRQPGRAYASGQEIIVEYLLLTLLRPASLHRRQCLEDCVRRREMFSDTF